MNFLDLADKTILIVGVANKKSVAYHIGEVLKEVGAKVLYSVQNESIKQNVRKFLRDDKIYICDVEKEQDIKQLASEVASEYSNIDGLVHSIAFADYSEGIKPFHETKKEHFLQAIDISCFSFIALSNAFKDLLSQDASVITISISTTRMAAESYGYMAPVKAALDSSLSFLAKSFSKFSNVRFNAVSPSLLKTSASAGIPGYIDYYLYAEQLTLRKKALQTKEVANTSIFLLSPRSSGINAQTIIIDAGMSVNYFDREIIRKVIK